MCQVWVGTTNVSGFGGWGILIGVLEVWLCGGVGVGVRETERSEPLIRKGSLKAG